MIRARRHTLPAAAALAALALGATACSGDTTPSDVASKAASAVASVGADLNAAAAEAKKKLDSVKDGADAKDAVRLGTPSKNADGHATVPVTVSNTATDKKSFAVQVNFRDTAGNLLDTVVVTVSDVAPGSTGQGTARSTRGLTGDVKADTGTALRY
ncbi:MULTISPECIES: hypothetical protein [unclassified Streptomyces]|uniref:hypothetical protein n=1 Tax=unclassified Streptomyces TaxID=2593676 RepID=UPI002E0FD822|nr:MULTISPECIES: hypothetical protein [unclassified Streptomyces]WSR22876.1 hypothetical protein OG573_29610 [Streptomyces sp. NBC_01205]